VDIQRLDHLMNLVGELVMTKAQILEVQRQLRERAGFSDLTVDLFRASRSLERKLGELQEGIVAVRMVPVGQVFSRLHQFVRTFARESGKEIEFHVFGEETEIDKRMLEEISDPLIHIIRNAVDHGIEPVEVRRRQGKPERGTVAVRAFPKGSYVVVTVEDDGAGIDPQEVLRSAHRRGLVAEDSLLEESEILHLIFLPGFTTSEAVTEISGRGVGLDVVRKNLIKLRGRIDVESEVGVGTRMTLTFPITLAIVRALAIRSGSETFAIPLSAVIENLRVTPAQVRTVEGREVLQLRGATLSLCRLDRLFDLPAAPRTADPLLGETETQEQEYLYVVIVGIAERRLGLVVERILGQQEIVIRPLGEACPHASGIAGATELGDGEVVLVLDVEALIAETLEGSLSRPAGGRLAV
jgi:two-component system chemotaxis sensor kinase CheA